MEFCGGVRKDLLLGGLPSGGRHEWESEEQYPKKRVLRSNWLKVYMPDKPYWSVDLNEYRDWTNSNSDSLCDKWKFNLHLYCYSARLYASAVQWFGHDVYRDEWKRDAAGRRAIGDKEVA